MEHNFRVDNYGIYEVSYSAVPTLKITVNQVHSDNILLLSSVDDIQKLSGKDADGILSTIANVALVVHTADCAPVALIDRHRRAIALLHAGWRGTYSGIIENGVSKMVKIGVSPNDIFAYIGPTIGVNDYQVGEEFLKIFPHSTTSKNGAIYMDLIGEIFRRLRNLRIDKIEHFSPSTYSTPWLHSYRRDGDEAGRTEFYLWLES